MAGLMVPRIARFPARHPRSSVARRSSARGEADGRESSGARPLLFITAIVFACATISNDNLPDLKTGNCRCVAERQQVALIVGGAGARRIPACEPPPRKATGRRRRQRRCSHRESTPRARDVISRSARASSAEVAGNMIGIGALVASANRARRLLVVGPLRVQRLPSGSNYLRCRRPSQWCRRDRRDWLRVASVPRTTTARTARNAGRVGLTRGEVYSVS